MGVWVLNHLPLIDFRPYKVGNNIQGMRIPDGAEKISGRNGLYLQSWWCR
jgi:hypothetical protein